MARDGRVTLVLLTLTAVAARPQEADLPPAVDVKPKELAGDGSAYQLTPAEGGGERQLEASARELLALLEPQSQQQQQKQALSEWAYASNITAENEQAMVSRVSQ